MDRKSFKWIENLDEYEIILMDRKPLRWIGNHLDG